MLEDQRLGTSTDAAEQSLDDDVLGPGRRQRGTARILPPATALRSRMRAQSSCRRDTLVPSVRRALGTGRAIPNLREIMSRNWWCRL